MQAHMHEDLLSGMHDDYRRLEEKEPWRSVHPPEDIYLCFVPSTLSLLGWTAYDNYRSPF